MKSRQSSLTPQRLRKLFTYILAVALLATLCPMGAGVALAQDEEKLDSSKAAEGQALFRAWCRTCHGENAKGDGPMAEHLSPKPADLTLLSQRSGGHFYFGRVREKIDGRDKVKGHGSRDMPVWGEAFRVLDEEGGEEAVRDKITALVHYLASIQAETSKP